MINQESEQQNNIKCKGLFFKGRVNSYISGNNIITQNKTIRLLKRKSCLGCEACVLFFKQFSEFLNDDPAILGNIENGKTYIPVIKTKIDNNTGNVVVINISFEEVKS